MATTTTRLTEGPTPPPTPPRRHRRRPLPLWALIPLGAVLQVPIIVVVYNPQLTHWPEPWPLVSLAPTVEPFIVLGYATFYVAPALPAIWILRRVQARRPLGSFVWRHPLISLIPLIYAIGFVYDMVLEI